MIRAFLVDDEPPARSRLRHLLADHGDVVVVGEAGDVEEARAAVAATHPDVLFLDIEMPEGRGTELAASLTHPRPLVVFATAFDRYALDAFAVNAADYLVKPITRARLEGTLARVRDRLAQRTDVDRELAAAALTQAQLLPRTFAQIDGFDCAAITAPARSVGGDFYLAQPIDARRYGVALGDVAGKGVPAGLVASSLQARLEAVSLRSAWTASQIIANINRTLCDTTGSMRFATLVYLEMERETGIVRIVNAGHPPLIVMRGGHLEWVHSTGPALGLLPEATFEQCALALDVGDTVVAYSDGMSEAVDDAGMEFGEARIAAEVMTRPSDAAEALSRHLLDITRTHRGGAPPADDATVMVIKRIDAHPNR